MSIRRRRQNRRIKKKSPREEKDDCCKNCKRESRPWWYAQGHIRYNWKTAELRSNQAKPCMCFSGTGAMDDLKKLEKKIMEECFVQTKISKCNGSIKIQFVSNGDVVRKILKEQRDKIVAEGQARVEAIEAKERVRVEAQKVDRNNQRLDQLKDIILKWEQEKNLPSSLWKDVTKNQLNEMKEAKDARNVQQVYILELRWIGQYYVGRTSIGYPRRCYIHGHDDSKKKTQYAKLKYKDADYEQSILLSIMGLINPTNKNFRCTHWMEWWLQKQMSDLGFHLPSGKESSPITRETFGGGPEQECPECVNICMQIRDEFDDHIFDEFLN